MTMSNELNEKDLLIMQSRQREEKLQKALSEKEAKIEADSSGYVQLGECCVIVNLLILTFCGYLCYMCYIL